MVYGISQYDLRLALLKNNQNVRSQSGKPTQKPSMKWIYFLFRVVNEVQLNVGGVTTSIVANVNSELRMIAKHFGKRAYDIYLNSG